MRGLLSFVLCAAVSGQATRHMRGSMHEVDKAAFAGELDPVHDYINLYRSKMGLSNLTKSEGLVQSANHTALKINEHKTLNHTLGNTTTMSRMREVGFDAAGKEVGEVYGVSFCRASVKTCAKLLVMTWAADPEFNKTLTSKDYTMVGAASQPAYAKDGAHNKTTMMMMGTDVEMYAAAGEEYGHRGSSSVSMFNWDTYVAHFA